MIALMWFVVILHENKLCQIGFHYKIRRAYFLVDFLTIFDLQNEIQFFHTTCFILQCKKVFSSARPRKQHKSGCCNAGDEKVLYTLLSEYEDTDIFGDQLIEDILHNQNLTIKSNVVLLSNGIAFVDNPEFGNIYDSRKGNCKSVVTDKIMYKKGEKTDEYINDNFNEVMRFVDSKPPVVNEFFDETKIKIINGDKA